MSEGEDKYDQLYFTVMQTAQGAEGFFDSVFSFLRRRTDFFQSQKQAEDIIVKACQVHFRKYAEEKKKADDAKKAKEEREKQKKEKELGQKEQEKQPEVKQEIKPKAPEPVIEEIPTTKEGEQKAEEGAKEGEKSGEEKQAPGFGNGGKTDHYSWTQTLEEVEVFIQVPENLKSKDLVVKIEIERLYVGIKGQPPIIDGQFCEKVISEESQWTLETEKNQKVIHIQLSKWRTSWHWWDCVIKGDPKIDTQKINPEPSNLADLDGETRGTVEKMMFDMRQKQMGKPSSDELQKQDKLKDFMKAHPELDFSKCKFN
eukprot:TRINITY_DN721_c0_g1_i7.p1 TRINITY_DN721_c0_g1~~TRINITY_DN721_c0_g1_i7.p1  ORF type:complete len:314 (-),score=102.75 TRINITY_DN721_c0_g1_i7:203-1144(-)